MTVSSGQDKRWPLHSLQCYSSNVPYHSSNIRLQPNTDIAQHQDPWQISQLHLRLFSQPINQARLGIESCLISNIHTYWRTAISAVSIPLSPGQGWHFIRKVWFILPATHNSNTLSGLDYVFLSWMASVTKPANLESETQLSLFHRSLQCEVHQT